MHNGQVALVPEWLERRQRRMQAEEAVEVEHFFARDVDAGAHRVVGPLAVRHDDVQPVRGAALEDDDQALGCLPGSTDAEGGPRQKTWNCRRTDNGQRAIAKKYAASDGIMIDSELSASADQTISGQLSSQLLPHLL